MNVEKEKLNSASKKDKELTSEETNRRRGILEGQIEDLKKENEILRDNYQNMKIREEDLKNENSHLLDSLNERSKLEESVINIGLSNNYFKNVAEIFKKSIDKR